MEISSIQVCYDHIVETISQKKYEDYFEVTGLYIEKLRELDSASLVKYFHAHIIDANCPIAAPLIDNQSLEFLDILLPHAHEQEVVGVCACYLFTQSQSHRVGAPSPVHSRFCQRAHAVHSVDPLDWRASRTAPDRTDDFTGRSVVEAIQAAEDAYAESRLLSGAVLAPVGTAA